MWRKTPYDDEFEEKRIEIEIHNAYEKGFKAGLQAQIEKTCDTCKHYNEFCETPMIKGCKLYERAQIDNKFWELDDNDDCISRKAVLSILADHFDNPFDRVRELPPVAISYDGDLISRQDAIDAMTLSNINQNMDDLNDNIGQKIKRSAQRILAQLPSVAIPNKVGHWISHYDEDAKEGWYECDRCHTERAFNTDFCPDCGAKMD